jgi:hypothetical protein
MVYLVENPRASIVLGEAQDQNQTISNIYPTSQQIESGVSKYISLFLTGNLAIMAKDYIATG